ncbi:MAG TPA: glycoside hydrolase family 9 protein, partial [Saprospiraceae bacterium]|nr:glycoside hydrolase family 9 protein [Saprospiraceae bacterium]
MKSPIFAIGNDVYEGTADFALKYMRQQRCGFNPYLKDSCHTHDGYIMGHGVLDSTFIDVVGGWHDASDYLQYLTTSANATFQMLFAYENNSRAFTDAHQSNGLEGKNGIPDIIDEAKWGLDWMIKMNPYYGVMFNQIADDRDHLGFRLPTQDPVSYGLKNQRPVYLVTGKQQGFGKFKNRSTGVSSSAAKYASSFALGSHVLKNFDQTYADLLIKKAIEAYTYANTHLGVNQTASNRAPYFYEEDNYVDDLELAAIQLYITTRDTQYMKEAIYWGELEPVTPWMIHNTARHYQWYPFVNLGHYLIAKHAWDPKVKEKFIGFMKQGLEAIYQRANQNGFLMGVPFIWCSNNLNMAALTQLRLYHQLTADDSYLTMEASLRDWLFGCNIWGTSMVVGLPSHGDHPVDPHSAFT